jgi:uncharacterized protein YjbI with pentapeptide repeats
MIMALRNELRQICENAKQDANEHYENIKKHPLTSLIIISIFIIALASLIFIPHYQVSRLDNSTEKTAQENQNRATLAQLIGGSIAGIGVLHGIFMTLENLKIANQNKRIENFARITENFARAVDQLGAIDQSENPLIEIRLGGIYTLERISNESERDYWPIMEIFTAYVMTNSPYKYENMDTIGAEQKLCDFETLFNNLDFKKMQEYLEDVLKMRYPQDIDAICTIIARRKFHNFEYNKLDNPNQQNYSEPDILHLDRVKLPFVTFTKAHLEGASLFGSYLLGSDFSEAYLQCTTFLGAILIKANFTNADLEKAEFSFAYLYGSNFKGANLKNAAFRAANLEGANLKGVKKLKIEQLLEVETLYDTKLDEDLREQLEKDFPERYQELIKKPEVKIQS